MQDDPSRMTWRALWLPRAGATAAEYEDAFALPTGAGWPLRAAVADGATESAFAGPWAARLAEGFVATPVAPGDEAAAWAAHLPAWRRAWQAAVDGRADALPWYAAAKVAEGAHATFLGLSLAADRWTALAVGDCCLFHLRGDTLRTAWPLDAPEHFHHRPPLLGSRPGMPVPALGTRSGSWQAGDTFLLATDALAAWLLRLGPAVARTWDQAALQAAVAEARAARTLRNDDVTLVVLETHAADDEVSHAG